jgi:hypothetical protein
MAARSRFVRRGSSVSAGLFSQSRTCRACARRAEGLSGGLPKAYGVSRRRGTLSNHSTTGDSMPTKPTVNPPERNGLSYIRSRTKQIANAEENIQRATAIETRRLM